MTERVKKGCQETRIVLELPKSAAVTLVKRFQEAQAGEQPFYISGIRVKNISLLQPEEGNDAMGINNPSGVTAESDDQTTSRQ